MLFKKLKLLPNKWRWGLELFVLFFAIHTAVPIQAQDSSKKLKNYISQQIQFSQKQKKNIYSILNSLEKDIKQSHLIINSIELEIPVIKKDIKLKEEKLVLVQEELDQILKKIYKNFFNTYLLEKIKQSSFLPTIGYFKNYSRNKEIITLLLTEEILISENEKIGNLLKIFSKKFLRKEKNNCSLNSKK